MPKATAEPMLTLNRAEWQKRLEVGDMDIECPFEKDDSFIAFRRYLDMDDLEAMNEQAKGLEEKRGNQAFQWAQLSLTIVGWGGEELTAMSPRLLDEQGDLADPGPDTLGKLAVPLFTGALQFSDRIYEMRRRRREPIQLLQEAREALPAGSEATEYIAAAIDVLSGTEEEAPPPASFPGEPGAVGEAQE